ncbi:hypothetical protein BCR33DRAFT_780364 [Rhizoclosmatium globosum]|uniref:Secreted protein n=1 Tax=Rhizoclosmatium globosum TaxID=329046 RepID=A0A1Y2CWJ0_9FUNG|nr:hypothetical protein BCR33DRAFT_780364 [Rhizoclosmatium globosum]|eukprot:ORY51380.1 hypothetical protein BCR33DRAFT_780364 [Rhizoclosmatium globosum]
MTSQALILLFELHLLPATMAMVTPPPGQSNDLRLQGTDRPGLNVRGTGRSPTSSQQPWYLGMGTSNHFWIAAASVTDQQRRSPQMGVSVVPHRLDQGGIFEMNGAGKRNC